MLYYSLNKQISAEKIIKDIVEIVNKQSDLNNKVLVIRLQEVDHYAGDSPVPKIEYKDRDSLT